MNDTCAMLSWPVLISKRRLSVSIRFMTAVVATSRKYESRVSSGTATPATASSPNPITGSSRRLSDTEQSPRPDEEDADDHQEAQHAHGRARHEQGADPFDGAEQQAAQDGAGQAAHAADDDNDERLHDGQGTHGGTDREHGGQQSARRSRQRA